ncbi:ABC transporter ATP-binding protein [Candidatus Saccharibacteria bacterium]|nr:ABC transporter ATP-binding protein [Candidatus Saccharibacteria bacterium]
MEKSVALIQLNDVSKIYGLGDATTVALEEVTLSIDKGEFVAVMGPSGCGKSTLMNMIGLLDQPTHGAYTLGGRSVAKLRTNQRAKVRRDKIGFIFQSFNLLPRLIVLENVALPLAYRGMTQTRRLKRASQLLARVGLQDREYYMPKQLSGGQAQQVAIARALINNPEIIIADEPTGNLDSASSRVVMELLSEIHQDGNTVLMVTHNPELTRYATRVVYMHDGAVVHDEKKPIGKIPARAKKIIFTQHTKTEEDDLAGVSALMHTIPGKDKLQKVVKKRRTRKAKSPRKKPARSKTHV